jgi:RNA polymerase sigma-70 factor (ECF subfamily)
LPAAQARPLPEDFASALRTAEQDAEDQDDVRRALEALGALPERQREVLYLCACEGLSAAAISLILGISVDAVKASLCLARKRLRQELKDIYEDRFPVV